MLMADRTELDAFASFLFLSLLFTIADNHLLYTIIPPTSILRA